MVKDNQKIDFSSCTTFNALPLDHKRFLLEYTKTYNAGRSYQKIFKSKIQTAIVQASKLLTKPNIQQALQEVSAVILQGDVAGAEELRIYWTRVLRGSITDVAGWNEGGITFTANSEDMEREKAQLIKKIKVTEKTSAKGDWNEVQTTVEVHDPLKASELLGRTHGMFKDKVDMNLSGEITIKVKGRK
jgi:phage terminase small subunit